MRGAIIVAAFGSLSVASGVLSGQPSAPAARVFSYMTDDADRPRLGMSTRSTGKRDTLGLLVEDVTKDGPADKAGIEEGDRLVSINSVNLRLSRDDADDSAMWGVTSRRLTRELGKHKAGEDVEVRVYRDGQTRTVHAKLVAAEDLEPRLKSVQSIRSAMEDRAVLGLSLGGSGSKRDTLGVLVVGVTDDGPAAKAGIEEGDRIAAVNGVDLRVERDDAGDWEASNSRVRRLNRTMEKVKAGDDVELRVYSQGQTRTAHAKAARVGDLRRQSGGFFFQDGGDGSMIRMKPPVPMPAMPPSIKVQPRIYFDGAEIERRPRLELESRAVETLQRALQARTRALRLRTLREWDLNESTTPRIAEPARVAVAATPAPRVMAAVRPAVRASVEAAVAAAPVAVAATRPVLSMRDGFLSRRAYDGTIGLPGLRLAPVGTDLASYFGSGSERGLLVVDVTSRWQGIRTGDVILSIDGRRVRGSDGSTSVVFRDGSRSAVELLRSGRRVTVIVNR